MYVYIVYIYLIYIIQYSLYIMHYTLNIIENTRESLDDVINVAIIINQDSTQDSREVSRKDTIQAHIA